MTQEGVDSTISDRKKEHLDIAATDASQSSAGAGWEHIYLVPASLPEVSLGELDLATDLVGCRLAAPLVIASMTGGHDAAIPINEKLAAAAQRLGVAIGSGSQRAALRDPSLAGSYTVLRQSAPGAVILANVGVCQLVAQGADPALDQGDIERVVEMLDAQLLIVHLNVVEELIQPEGDGVTSGLIAAIERMVAWSPVPVVAKETGAGLDGGTARALAGVGVAGLDVGGAGGTSFSRVEGVRAAQRGDERRARLGETFADWGIPTALSLLETRAAGIPLVATGGVRSGLDAAKAITLGATAVGIGRPALSAAMKGFDSLITELEIYLDELRVAMVLTGSPDVPTLGRRRPILTGIVLEWAEQRGLT